ncbi:MAG: type II toxin-antitoxin system VapC family toxin [Treponemataceae bacterium]|nr:type II toxin-antitoxin system VapC family toxin [Spirochaetales bacterium]MDY6031481.1 type II toxin-antitoxin system VapC family toxin [Treponemataceae bacterium]
MICLDSCFLIDLYWTDSPRHEGALEYFETKIKPSKEKILVFYNVFNEFIHVITDSKRFENALAVKQAIEIVNNWCDIENIVVVYPNDDSFVRSKLWMNMYALGRKRIIDTEMASCYLLSGGTQLVTANPNDFEIFDSFELLNYAEK